MAFFLEIRPPDYLIYKSALSSPFLGLLCSIFSKGEIRRKEGQPSSSAF